MACIAATVGLFSAPWRQRAWFIVIGFAAISLLHLGTLADLEHALAILLVLAVDRSLRVQRTTVHEQRLLAVSSVLALGVTQLIVMLIPTNGPFGQTELWLETALPDVLFDTAVILAIAFGLWRGRRWAWIIALLLATLNIAIGGLALALRVLFLVLPEEAEGISTGDLDVTAAAGFLWFGYLVKKFNPRYEPIYLLYRDEGDLARIGRGLTHAFLPDATLRQLAAAGVDLIRR